MSSWSPFVLTTRVRPPRAVLAAVFAAYAIVTTAVTLHHEPWRDEADAWLVARDLPLEETVSWTRRAGTQFLWYALLLPLARGGAPYVALNLLNLALALAAAAVFLFRAPFTLTTKILFLFSFYGLYEYTAIARTYALGILLTFVLVALDPRRGWAYAIVVFLLANANAHSVAIAAAAAVFVALRRQRLPLAIALCGLGVAAVQLYTPGHVIPPNVMGPPYYGAFLEAAALGFLPSFPERRTVWVAALLLIAVAAVIRRNAAALTLFVFTMGGLAAIFIYVWLGGYRHYGLVLVGTIASLWLAGDTRSRVAPLVAVGLNVCLALSIPLAVRFVRDDLTMNFSGSREMARYLVSRGLDTREIAAHAPAQCESVLPYLRRRTFWYPALGRNGSYMQWDRAYRIAQGMRPDDAASAAATQLRGRPHLYLSNAEIPHPELDALTLLYATQEPLMNGTDPTTPVNDERYWLYERR